MSQYLGYICICTVFFFSLFFTLNYKPWCGLQVNHPNIVGYRAAWLEPFLGENPTSSSDEQQPSTTASSQHRNHSSTLPPPLPRPHFSATSTCRIETFRQAVCLAIINKFFCRKSVPVIVYSDLRVLILLEGPLSMSYI